MTFLWQMTVGDGVIALALVLIFAALVALIPEEKVSVPPPPPPSSFASAYYNAPSVYGHDWTSERHTPVQKKVVKKRKRARK